jgi:Na+-translocating ferredoxin:NAD+ oxidoreductase RnfD subunit
VKPSRFLRTPKGLAIAALAVLVALAIVGQDSVSVARSVLAALGAAMALDALALRARKGRWVFPDGALLTGLFVAMIVSPMEPWPVIAATAAIAVGSKYVLRGPTANVFNPAALALVIAYHLFDTRQSWWGALPDAPTAAVAVLLAAGVLVTRRVDRFPAMLTFLGAYYLLAVASSFIGDPGHVAGLYRAPDANAALFFACFMITDPPTSPPGTRDQVIFATIAAVASFAFFEVIGSYYLVAGLLVANAWEGVRRVRVHRAHLRPDTLGLGP